MNPRNAIKNTMLAVVIAGAGLLGSVGGASAYVVCNHAGDCWHTDTRVHFSHIRLTFHPDSWWDHHKSNHRYTWHDVDNDHDWHHGYWDHGTWHPV